MTLPPIDINNEPTLQKLYKEFLNTPKKTKVIIVIEGGCVQCVQSNKPENLEVIVVDYDGQDLLANRKEVAPREFADVWPIPIDPITLDV